MTIPAWQSIVCQSIDYGEEGGRGVGDASKSRTFSKVGNISRWTTNYLGIDNWEVVYEEGRTGVGVGGGRGKIESSAAQRPMLIRRLRLVSSTEFSSSSLVPCARVLHSFFWWRSQVLSRKVLKSGVGSTFCNFLCRRQFSRDPNFPEGHGSIREMSFNPLSSPKLSFVNQQSIRAIKEGGKDFGREFLKRGKQDFAGKCCQTTRKNFKWWEKILKDILLR